MKKLSEITGRHHMVLIHRVQNAQSTEMPVLWLFINGEPKVFQQLVDYLQYNRNKGLMWKRRAARSLGLFFDFTRSFEFDEAKSVRNRHAATLQAFIEALQYGTIPPEGIDESGLYWAPMSATIVAELARHLDNFTTFIGDHLESLMADHPLRALANAFDGPPVDGSSMIRFIVTAKKLRSLSFLRHLKDPGEKALALRRQSRTNLGLEKRTSGYRSVKAMPFELVSKILEHGFVKDENASELFEREDVTAKMIFILLIGGGLRRSEPLHMWFNDVTFPTLDGRMRCIPVLRHPSQAPTFIEGENITRMQYLRQRGLAPRHMAPSKSMHVGWKNLPIDESTFSTEIFFIHEGLEQQFSSYYSYYLNIRRHLVSLRKARGESEHPFLFISNGEDRATGRSYQGSPYSKKAFDDAFSRALTRVERRIGQTIKRGKHYGTTPHALRHAYAQILVKAGAPQKAIQKAMHHRSIISQEVYTQPEWEDVNAALNCARNNGSSDLLFPDRPMSDPYDQTQELKETWRHW